jgi:hypothetical protein
MAKVKTVTIVCDGCSNELPEGPGVSTVHVDEIGSESTRRLDLCPACTTQLPEGTKRKRPEKKEGKKAA